MIRLCQARAKCDLSYIVTIKHVNDVIEIWEYSYGKFLKETETIKKDDRPKGVENRFISQLFKLALNNKKEFKEEELFQIGNGKFYLFRTGD